MDLVVNKQHHKKINKIGKGFKNSIVSVILTHRTLNITDKSVHRSTYSPWLKYIKIPCNIPQRC